MSLVTVHTITTDMLTSTFVPFTQRQNREQAKTTAVVIHFLFEGVQQCN